MSFWCTRFRSGNFNVANELREQPDFVVNNDELQANIEADLPQNTWDLAAWFNVIVPTILIHLRQVGKKLNKKKGTTRNVRTTMGKVR